MAKSKQANLFNESNYKTKQQVVKEQEHKKRILAQLTPDDKLFLKLEKIHLTKKLHIRSGKWCQSALMWYITNGNLIDTSADKVSQMINRIKPKWYYHYLPNANPNKIIIQHYNTALLRKILIEKPNHDLSLDKDKSKNENKPSFSEKSSNSSKPNKSTK